VCACNHLAWVEGRHLMGETASTPQAQRWRWGWRWQWQDAEGF
jgi:hypothetical protein